MHTIIGSSGWDSIWIILFYLHGSKAGFFEGHLLCVGQYDFCPPTFVLEKELI